MADLDSIDYGLLPGSPQQCDAPLRITVHPRAEPRFVPVDHDPFADDGAGDRVPTRWSVGGVPNSTAGSWGANPAGVSAARFSSAGLPNDTGDSWQFTPIPSSSRKRAASILSCDTAYIRCMQSRAGNPVWCNAARDACLRTGVPTIFPGGFVGQGG
jgi:hypothetical protein